MDPEKAPLDFFELLLLLLGALLAKRTINNFAFSAPFISFSHEIVR